MRNKVLSIVAISIISCSPKQSIVSIDNLEKTRLHYSELPTKVKKKVFVPNNGIMKIGEEDSPDFAPFQEVNTPPIYEYYEEKDAEMAWIYHGYIKNKNNKKVYYLEKPVDRPTNYRYIVDKDYLYIANHYNVYERDSLSYTFTRYSLR